MNYLLELINRMVGNEQLTRMLFAGNLYLLALTQSTPASWLTPLGGLCMISAWLVFAVGALTMRTKI